MTSDQKNSVVAHVKVPPMCQSFIFMSSSQNPLDFVCSHLWSIHFILSGSIK